MQLKQDMIIGVGVAVAQRREISNELEAMQNDLESPSRMGRCIERPTKALSHLVGEL